MLAKLIKRAIRALHRRSLRAALRQAETTLADRAIHKSPPLDPEYLHAAWGGEALKRLEELKD